MPVLSKVLMMLVLIVAGCSQGDPGVLVSNDTSTNGFRDFSQGTQKSFGIFVCASGGPVTMISADAKSSDGEIEVLGAMLYEAADGFVGAVDGFPPEGLDPATMEDIQGAVASSDCDDPDPATRNQVILGVERTGTAGGVIDGVTVVFEGGSIDVDYTIVLCGDADEFCEGFDDEEESG
jgi:hypothetical protein